MKRHRFQISSQNWPEKLAPLGEVMEPFILLDSHQSRDSYSRYQWLCAFGIAPGTAPLKELDELNKLKPDWYFGHLNYNLKNQIEALQTGNPDFFSWPDLYFFQPETVIYATGNRVEVESFSLQSESDLESILKPAGDTTVSIQKLRPNFSREQYLEKIARLKEHLQYGSIYEVNFCMDFSGNGTIPVASVFIQLNSNHAAPFSAFYRCDNDYLLCASPERYLQKRGDKVLCQPIKGTAARYEDPESDRKSREELLKSEKERAENVMIVDLVRNDLSKFAQKGTVQVDELFGIYTFNAVHQMISTVSCRVRPEAGLADYLRASFPMGSMTGAPKYSAMKIIEEEEGFNRSLYSGSVGYVDPRGNFDFNVVIRSLFYNADSKNIAVRVGSAITVHCDAEREYEECKLKAEKLLHALSPT